MKNSLSIFVIARASLMPSAQGSHFSKDGLSFDYPAAWRLEEDGDLRPAQP